MTLTVGTCVQHRKLPDWGPGIVLGVRAGHKVDVFFENHPSGKAITMIANPALLEVSAAAPTEKLTAYQERALRPAKRSSTRKKAPPPDVGTQAEAVARFVALFPGGFGDPAYLEQERNYKLEAAGMFSRLLSREIRLEALREQRVDGLVAAALEIDAATNLISPFEKAALRDGLRDAPGALRFFGALSALLDAGTPSEGHFAALAHAVETLPATRGRVFTWPIVTVFPFLAAPDRHLFVKPVATRNEAHRLRHDLGYDPAPNWTTYASALAMAEKLKVELSGLGCRDMIDVQSFIYRV
ncbi:MAG: hypothetical protein WB493_09355 [Anaeromyxobacteraceae bacterium]